MNAQRSCIPSTTPMHFFYTILEKENLIDNVLCECCAVFRAVFQRVPAPTPAPPAPAPPPATTDRVTNNRIGHNSDLLSMYYTALLAKLCTVKLQTPTESQIPPAAYVIAHLKKAPPPVIFRNIGKSAEISEICRNP